MIDVYVTFPNAEEARRVSRELIKKRLIACSNIHPVESIYRWRGKVEETLEVAARMKARKSGWRRLREEIARLHPYEVPCIIMHEARASKSYADWVRKETA